jgi:AcrR family transcriptional regulator
MDRLPRGRHGLSPEFVAHNQRERLIAALAEVVYENGYDKTTVSLIGKQAGVSKADFYKHFETKDECLLAAYDVVFQRIHELTVESCRGRKKWATKVHDALSAQLAFLAGEPALAHLLLVEGLRGGREIYARYQEALQSFVPLLNAGAPSGQRAGPRPAGTDEAVIGGIASLLGGRVLAGEAGELEQLLPAVVEFALTPYLGTAEARRIGSAG